MRRRAFGFTRERISQSAILGVSLFLLTSFAISVAADQTSSALHVSDNLARASAGVLATGPWYIDRMDRSTASEGADRGSYVSIATRFRETFISYYDATDTSLRAAYRHESSSANSGNCGPSNAWQCVVIDNDGDVGQWSSIAAAPYDTNARFGIAYFDATNHVLKFASFNCSSVPCTVSPQTVAVSFFGWAGLYTSAKYDLDGVVHIAFQAAGAGIGALDYAHSVSSGGNCGNGPSAGKWQCDLIESGPGIGQYASLDLISSNQPRIAYYDAGNKRLKYAALVGSGGNCGPANTWQCDTIDDAGDVGRFASLHAGPGDNPRIAYYDSTNGKLKFAQRAEMAGNCGPLFMAQRLWQCDSIADMGAGLTQAGVSLEVIGGGDPVIAYMDASDSAGPPALSVARSRRPGTAAAHNCGPTYPGALLWWCEAIDGGGSWTDEAAYTAMAADYQGKLSIAYYESDDYYHTGYLKLARQGILLDLPFVRK